MAPIHKTQGPVHYLGALPHKDLGSVKQRVDVTESPLRLPRPKLAISPKLKRVAERATISFLL